LARTRYVMILSCEFTPGNFQALVLLSAATMGS
jgi:hypothetical protein